MRDIADPTPTDQAVSQRTSRQPTRDTEPELALRRRLHRSGLRYRVDYEPIRGLRRRADIAFTRSKIAVFVDGCFWHSCPEHGTQPKSNARWWADKLEKNRDRDADTNRRLAEAGWNVIRIWEHEDPEIAAQRIATEIHDRSN